jgi:hypothetical protein
MVLGIKPMASTLLWNYNPIPQTCLVLSYQFGLLSKIHTVFFGFSFPMLCFGDVI